MVKFIVYFTLKRVNMTKKPKTSRVFKIFYKTLYFFASIKYHGTTILNEKKLSKRDIVIVSNHAQLNGPIIGEILLPKNCFIWANGQMFKKEDVAEYAMEDFFPYKSKWLRPIYKLAAKMLSYLLPGIMANARAVPVYRDMRIVSTFRESVRLLEGGNSLLIFPECHQPNNNIINKLQTNFVDVARFYYRRTGRELTFLPMYISPTLKLCTIGEGIKYNSKGDIELERERITDYLDLEITRLGRSLPKHTVIPFDNISSKEYITNKEDELTPHIA